MENFCSSKYQLSWLQKKRINYIIMDNLDIVPKYDDVKYSYLTSFCNILGKYR